MNNARRKQIAELVSRIEAARTELDSIKDEIDNQRDTEQDYRDNMPEAFGDGEKGRRADEVIEHLEGAMSTLEDVDNDLSEALDALNEAAQ